MYRRHLANTRRKLFSTRKLRFRLVFWGSAIIVGATAALFAIAAQFADSRFKQFYDQEPWLALLVPPFGLVLISWLTRRFFPGAEGSGIPQAIAALQLGSHGLRQRVLSLKIAVGKILLTLLGLFSGASIGREGPTVHVGASLMFALHNHQLFRRKNMSQLLIIAGGAAGISAAFNTPLAGILFAIEEMARKYHKRTSSVLLIAVILAGLTAMSFLGQYNYFGETDATLDWSHAWFVVPILGVVGGLLGGSFSSLLIYGSRRLASTMLRQPVLLAFVCGLLLSVYGFLSNGATFGTGYHEAKTIMEGEHLAFSYPLLKFLATATSYLSGIPGGIFAPSLSIGAGLGADMAHLLPYAPYGAIVILGMVAYFTGVVQTPITAFVIVMEMTNNSGILLPLMATALIANAVSHLVCPTPIYQALAEAYLNKTQKPLSKRK